MICSKVKHIWTKIVSYNRVLQTPIKTIRTAQHDFENDTLF